ncbi:hypothetical protein KUCAC02_021267 [Chaenocephalus aceratus]|uniref:Uncharacterized protein n=1 Tax=Chaenocephalus aceratus TaxID=36190 RepID=A0ACB9XFL4_CHAAC|nr:hypothetical protein KUCAC02_021267 [Chaenocephalus aceratus]
MCESIYNILQKWSIQYSCSVCKHVYQYFLMC